MKLLLDTHAWIFSLAAPERLSKRARSALAESPEELALSPVSVWETILLAQRGRLRLDPDPVAWVRQALRLSPTTMVPVTHEIALTSRTLTAFPNEDPADRFLVATCLVHDLTLVTADTPLRRYRRVRSLW